jgi:hypothetical protein
VGRDERTGTAAPQTDGVVGAGSFVRHGGKGDGNGSTEDSRAEAARREEDGGTEAGTPEDGRQEDGGPQAGASEDRNQEDRSPQAGTPEDGRQEDGGSQAGPEEDRSAQEDGRTQAGPQEGHGSQEDGGPEAGTQEERREEALIASSSHLEGGRRRPPSVSGRTRC